MVKIMIPSWSPHWSSTFVADLWGSWHLHMTVNIPCGTIRNLDPTYSAIPEMLFWMSVSGVLLDVGLQRKTVYFKLLFGLGCWWPIWQHVCWMQAFFCFCPYHQTWDYPGKICKYRSWYWCILYISHTSFVSFLQRFKRALHAYTLLNLLYGLQIGVLVSVVNEDGGGLMASVI